VLLRRLFPDPTPTVLSIDQKKWGCRLFSHGFDHTSTPDRAFVVMNGLQPGTSDTSSFLIGGWKVAPW